MQQNVDRGSAPFSTKKKKTVLVVFYGLPVLKQAEGKSQKSHPVRHNMYGLLNINSPIEVIGSA